MTLRFVTGNKGKVEEARAALQPLGIALEQVALPHPEVQADTLEEVARERARWLRGKVPEPFFVDDAGLFVDALRGFPGVYSAYVHRTLGWQGLLTLLAGQRDRRARFACALAHMGAGAAEPRLFRGECVGRIAEEPRGAQGFGFDPVFVPEGHDRTFAQMGPEEKDPLSHRGRALAAMAASFARHPRE